MNKADLISTLERLELYMSAGLPLDRALLALAQIGSKKHKILLNKVLEDVMSGGRISTAFAKHLKLSMTLCSLIEHGEASGNLPKSLILAHTMLDRQGETLKKCLSAMIYPIVIALFASVLTIGMVRGVMPQITPMLKSLHVSLPLLTRAVIYISDLTVSYGMYIVAGIVVSMMIVVLSYSQLKRFKYACQYVVMRLPIIGGMVFSYSLSIFLRSLGSLVESGMPVSGSYVSTSTTVPLLPLRSSLVKKTDEIKRGVSCSQVILKASTRVPAHVPALLSAGEASGTFGSSLVRAATLIDRDMDHGLKRLTALIEPVLMIGMGSVVGGIALSIMMPIYDISKALQH